jgi:hypothetical protein
MVIMTSRFSILSALLIHLTAQGASPTKNKLFVSYLETKENGLTAVRTLYVKPQIEQLNAQRTLYAKPH